MNNDDFNDLDPDEKAPDRAFVESAGVEWKDKELEPFSYTRQRAADAMGLRYATGRLSADEVRELPNPEYRARLKAEAELARKKKPTAKRIAELEKFIADRAEAPEVITVYDGMTEDVALVLWICLQPDSKCMRIRRKPREYQEEFDRWAEENGLGLNGSQLEDATAVFIGIVNNLNASKGQPDIPGSDKAEAERPN